MKRSRYQDIVWRQTVLLPIVEGHGFLREYLPNAEQIGRYFPKFYKAFSTWQRSLDQDDPDWLSSGQRPELVRAAQAVLDTFTGPFSLFDLAFEVDRLEKVVARVKELEESAKAVTRAVQADIERLRGEADEHVDKATDLLRRLGEEAQANSDLRDLLADAHDWAQYAPDWAREKHDWDAYDRQVKETLSAADAPAALAEGEECGIVLDAHGAPPEGACICRPMGKSDTTGGDYSWINPACPQHGRGLAEGELCAGCQRAISDEEDRGECGDCSAPLCLECEGKPLGVCAPCEAALAEGEDEEGNDG